MRTCVRTSSSGSPVTIFRKALIHGNVALAIDTAREMPHVPLEDALRLVVLMATKRDRLYDGTAARFAQRLIAERRLGLDDARRVLALVEVLPDAPGGVAVALQRFVVSP